MSSSLGPRRILATPGLGVLYLWTFLSKLSVLAPFFAIFLAHRVGVGTAEIALLFATYSATRVLSEVPLGLLADRIGETPTLRLSSVLALAGVACLAFGPLPALFLGQALFALSESASSGVQESLLYRLCNDRNEEGHPAYRQAQPAFTAAAWTGVVAAGALGTLVATVSLELLGGTAVAVAAVAVLLSLCLPLVRASHDRAETEALRLRQLFLALADAAEFSFWFFAGACSAFVLTVTYFTIQPLLNELELAGPGNGLLYSAVTVFAAWGAHQTTRLNSVFTSWHAAAAAALALVFLAILGLRFSVSLAMVFVAMALLRFAWGWLDATCTTAVNEAVPIDGLRATILSAQSLLAGLLSMTALFVFAYLGLSAESMLVVLAVVAAAGTALTAGILMRRRNDDGSDLRS